MLNKPAGLTVLAKAEGSQTNKMGGAVHGVVGTVVVRNYTVITTACDLIVHVHVYILYRR